jgi:lipoic acid synthetase
MSKERKEVNPEAAGSPPLPEWIRPAFRKRPYLEQLAPRLRELGVATVCESARCPNLGECFSNKEATIMLLGTVCTRNCRFCAVAPGKPQPVDAGEPLRVAKAAKELGLKHIVLTSVTRDDLPDGGAGQFVATLRAIRELLPTASVELLVPDFAGNNAAIRAVIEAGPEVFAHNMETIPRLYPRVRPQADWRRSLAVLAAAKSYAADYRAKSETKFRVFIKSGLMVGLGESRAELMAAFSELAAVGADILTVGQYLQPTPEHLPVVEYLTLEAYDELAEAARKAGIPCVVAGPLVRSSYRAGEAFKCRSALNVER